MRVTLEKSLIASNAEKNDLLINLYLDAQQDLAYFKKILMDLEAAFSVAEPLKKRELYDEVQVVVKLIKTLDAYIDTLSATTTLGFNGNKMEDRDVAVLEAQVRGIKALRALIETPARPNPLSTLIDEAGKMEYNVSAARRWLRRGAFVLGALISGAIAVVAVAALMTPGVNIIAAAVMVPTMLASAAAFFYLRSPVVVNTAIAAGPFHASIASAVPSSLGVATAAGLGVSSFSKLRITNPVREETARNSAAAVMNGYIETLKQTINVGENRNAKAFLIAVLNKASEMYNEGMSSRVVELRSSKTEKARLILREVAKVIEHVNYARLTTDDILERKVGNSNYTFEQLLNSQRNTSTFWKSKSSTLQELRYRGVILERNPKSISFSMIASAAR